MFYLLTMRQQAELARRLRAARRLAHRQFLWAMHLHYGKGAWQYASMRLELDDMLEELATSTREASTDQ